MALWIGFWGERGVGAFLGERKVGEQHFFASVLSYFLHRRILSIRDGI